MPANPLGARQLYYRITEGIRITVRPMYIAEQSRPAQRHHVFSYGIRIENVGTKPAQLLTRRWFIHDEGGEDTEVEGAGVIGEQPLIPVGGVYEYSSFCVLRGSRGWMEGWYGFVRPDGEAFDALIPRFDLEG